MDNVIPLANAKTLKIDIELAEEGIRVNEATIEFLRKKILQPEHAKIVPELNEHIIEVQKIVADLKRRLVELKRKGGVANK